MMKPIQDGSTLTIAGADALPSASRLSDDATERVVSVVRAQLRKDVTEEADLRAEKLLRRVVQDETAEDPIGAFFSNPDFHSLLRACLADIESEKTEAYAFLATTIRKNKGSGQLVRHFILSLRDLSMDEITALRKAAIAKMHDLIPAVGRSVPSSEFLLPGTPGSYASVMVANLTAKGFVHNGNITQLGVDFSRACWAPEDLLPISIKHKAWSGHRVSIIWCDKIGVSLADPLERALRASGIQSSGTLVDRHNWQQVRLYAGIAVLIVGDDLRHLSRASSFVELVAAKVPTILVYTTATRFDFKGAEFLRVLSLAGMDEQQVVRTIHDAIIQITQLS